MSSIDDAKATTYRELLQALLSATMDWSAGCHCVCLSCHKLTVERNDAVWHRDRIDRGELPWISEDQQ